MNRATIVRGIQLIVVITLGTFAWILYKSIHEQKESLAAGFSGIRPGWLLLAAALALQEGVCGGLRIFVLGRLLSRELQVRTAVISEFVLMFCAGVTPGQLGGPAAQIAVLVNGGMDLVEVATVGLLAGLCTVVFFLSTAVLIYGLRSTGHLVVTEGGERIDWLLGLSVGVFGAVFLGLVLCAAYPPLLKGVVRLLAPPCGVIWRGILRPLTKIGRLAAWATSALAKRGDLSGRALIGIDELHVGFGIYLRRGKRAYAVAQLLTFGFFGARFAVAYFILLGLGLSTTPSSFVTFGPPIAQVLLVQALLNFALYLSPTPGASGIAEASSTALMSPWVRPPYVLPYLVLWRILALFLCMFVGGVYVFRYLGTDVLEERIKATEEKKRALRAA